jgi:hypothetical protein
MKKSFGVSEYRCLIYLRSILGANFNLQQDVRFEELESCSVEEIVECFDSIPIDAQKYFTPSKLYLYVALLDEVPEPKDITRYFELLSDYIDTDDTELVSFLYRNKMGQYKFGKFLDDKEDISLFDITEPEIIDEINKLLEDDIVYYNTVNKPIMKFMNSEQIHPKLVDALEIKLLKYPVFQNDLSFMNLCGHNLWKRSLEELQTIFSKIPQSILCLDLSFNLKIAKRTENSVEFLANLPDPITAKNHFMQALAAIPSNVFFVDLRKNGLQKLKYYTCLAYLPETVRYVLIKDDVLVDLRNFKEVTFLRDTIPANKPNSFFTKLNGKVSIIDCSQIANIRESRRLELIENSVQNIILNY